jgi:hypothetical protein
MKNKLISIACVSLLTLGFAQVSSADDHKHGKKNRNTKCSNATLKGSYLYASSGIDVDGHPISDAGLAKYDGNGHISDQTSTNEIPVITTYTGTYTINDDCTGTVVYDDNTHYTIFTGPTGDILSFIQTDAGAKIAGEQKRVAP